MTAPGFIYAIQSGDAVKIGFAKDPARRLSELNVGSPTDHVLVGIFPGTKDDERRCHKTCSAQRIRGEWFRKEGAVHEVLRHFVPRTTRRLAAGGSGMTFKKIIDEIGIAPLAELLSVEESHVRTMKARDSIPPEYWGLIVDEAARREISDISFETLRRMRSARFAGRSVEPAPETQAAE